MTTHTDRIRQMAQEAGLLVNEVLGEVRSDFCDGVDVDDLTRFAQLVAEDCAKHVNSELTRGRSPMGKVASDSIRARYSLKD